MTTRVCLQKKMAVAKLLSNLTIYTSIGEKIFVTMKKSPNRIVFPTMRSVSNTQIAMKNANEKEIVKQPSFDGADNKNKNTYLEMIRIFVNRDQVYRRGHVDFIYSALKSMEEFGVHRDLEVYRALIDVLPKGKFVARNMLQAEFMHYPKQQQCIIDLLQQMEDNGVMPDAQMQDQLMNIFGKRGYPLRKYWRMMYWMPKFKNIDPFCTPRDLPNDVLELAKLAITRISGVDPQVKITEYQTKDIEESIDDTWIISAQSPTQEYLVKKHDPKEPLYVEGAFKVWIRDRQVNYFQLRANAKPLPQEKYDEDDVTNIKINYLNLEPPIQKPLDELRSVHEQDDGTILALCATGTSSKDSLLSWIRHLEKNGNPALSTIPIVFTLRSSPKEVVVSEGVEESRVETPER
ncbi:hypothetical protein HHI36_015851 [Cryptolaemus montrouzieri]|uniref:Evolutionarily conserved signaling intermediate in Toll pathway, mitochondrial n=1 Tax=Cryptolaemus montrouzieri TaxID=559131 RepID=A0ABD2N719_9CUCU